MIREVPPVELKKEEVNWKNVVEMYSQVKNIDDEQGVVYLDCKYEKDTDETFERIYPIARTSRNQKETGLSGKFQDPCSKRGQGLNPKLQTALSGLIKDSILYPSPKAYKICPCFTWAPLCL